MLPAKLIFKIIIPGLLLVTASGCAANYNCNGLPEGVTCMSARDVYEATEYAEYLGTKPVDNMSVNDSQATQSRIAQPSNVPAEDVAVQRYSPDQPIPIRTPEKLIKIWIAPWEDSEGSLHMSSVIYSEIESRKWVVGEKVSNAQEKITPLDVRSRNVDSRTSNNGAANDLSGLTFKHPLNKGEK